MRGRVRGISRDQPPHPNPLPNGERELAEHAASACLHSTGKPYAEDMGRHAIRYNVTGYVIGPNYLREKEDLIQALEGEDAGQFVDPYRGSMLMMCERYAVIETREKGGYCVFEMAFCEAGVAGNSLALLQTATRGDVNTKADAAAGAMSETLDQVLAAPP